MAEPTPAYTNPETVRDAIGAALDWMRSIGISDAALSRLFGTGGEDPGRYLIRHLMIGIVKYLPGLISELQGYIQPAVNAVTTFAQQVGSPILAELEVPLKQFASQAINDKFAALKATGQSTPENAEATAIDALASAFGFGMASAATAGAFEAVVPKNLNVLDGVAPLLAHLAGFDEVTGQIIDKLYENAFGKSLEYLYRSTFKPELPSEGDAVRWHSQRLLSDTALRGLFQYSGLKSEYEEPFVQSAYRAIQPRALTSLFEDQEFPEAQVRALLDFAGVRDQDKEMLVSAYRWNSTKNVRSKYLDAVFAAASKGTIDMPTLDGHLHTLNFSQQAINYVHSAVALIRLETLAELYRKSVSVLYETGQIDDSQYVPALQAIGLDDATANAYFAVDQARLKGKVLVAEERELAKQQAQVLREQIAAIQTQYLNS